MADDIISIETRFERYVQQGRIAGEAVEQCRADPKKMKAVVEHEMLHDAVHRQQTIDQDGNVIDRRDNPYMMFVSGGPLTPEQEEYLRLHDSLL